MQRLFCLLVVFVTILLSACGGAPSTTSSTAPASSSDSAADASNSTTAPASDSGAAASTSNTDAPVEITYMMWGTPEELAVWNAIVEAFHAANPNIRVKVEVSDWDSYWDKLKTLYAGGTPPDVFAMDAPLYPDWQSRGVLLNMQPYIDATPGMFDDIYPNTLTAYKRDDGYYGLPRDFQTVVLYYNKDMFDEAQLPYPDESWTYEKLREVAKALTKDVDGDGIIDQFGFSPDLWDMETFWSSALWSHGAEVISEDYSKTLLGEPKAREVWRYIAAMVLEDKSVPTPAVSAEYGGDPFAAGRSAMAMSGHWVVPEYAQLDFAWDVAPMPSGPAGRFTSVNSAGFVIAKDSKNPDAAWEFVKFAVGKEGQQRLTELGFAIPVLKSIAESSIFLEQQSAPIKHQIFLDAMEYARPKPTFAGYEEWASIIGDGLVPVWNDEQDLDSTLDEIVPAADEVLAR